MKSWTSEKVAHAEQTTSVRSCEKSQRGQAEESRRDIMNGDMQNENHRLFSPSEMYLPEMAERNGLLLARAASASRIRPRPVC